MDSEARLARALAARGGPRRDPGFTLAVIRAAEVRRYRRQVALSMLRGAGLAAAAAALVVPVLALAGENMHAAQSATVTLLAAVALVFLGRLAARRADTVLGR